MNLQMLTDVASLILIFCGALLVLAAAIGLRRFRDTMSRVHAITKPQTTGLILTVVGAMIRVLGSGSFHVSERGDLGVLVLLILFTFCTNPVSAQRLGRVARREGLYGDKDHMLRNDAPASRALRSKTAQLSRAKTGKTLKSPKNDSVVPDNQP